MSDTPTTEGVLERIVREIKEHDAAHPDHGIGCVCHDEHARSIRVLIGNAGLNEPEHLKSRANLKCVLNYITRS